MVREDAGGDRWDAPTGDAVVAVGQGTRGPRGGEPSARRARRITPFDITFDRCGRFPGVLYLTPAPLAPVELLISRLAQVFPEHPPYGGTFGAAPPPHLTVAKSADDAVLDTIQAKVETHVARMALSVLVNHISISEEGLGPAGTWAVRHELTLA